MAGIFSMLKQTIRIFTQEDFPKNPHAPSISESEQRALAVGLINSEQLTAYTDSLTTGLPQDRILQGLTDAWDIYDKEGAYSIIEWLQKEGHRVYFPEIYPLIKTDPDERNKRLETLFGENAEKAIRFADNLLECISERGNDDFAAFNDENMKKGILAWDLGRLIAITRMSFDIGYLDEKTAWGVIKNAYEMAIKEYKDWKELAVAYLIGRGMWSGDNMMLNGLYGIAQKALEHDNSPWKKLSLK
ncbi:DUF1266 domain-containing protein [Treponema sp. TIM-1]|uniref:DUF1266 domain-containing protein n=1 Tax=Treponema sp. TIM-1 TaxID=2898417 RepID=UPI0039810E7E